MPIPLEGLLPAVFRGGQLAPDLERSALHSALLDLNQAHPGDWIRDISKIDVLPEAQMGVGTLGRYVPENSSIQIKQGQEPLAILEALAHETQHVRDAREHPYSDDSPFWGGDYFGSEAERRAWPEGLLAAAEAQARSRKQPFLFDRPELLNLAKTTIYPHMDMRMNERGLDNGLRDFFSLHDIPEPGGPTPYQAELPFDETNVMRDIMAKLRGWSRV